MRCPHLCDPHNGLAIFDDTRVVGTMASFECFPEFELSDTEYRVCDDNGNWSSPSPVCTPVGKYLEDIQMFLLNMSFISRVKWTIFIFHECEARMKYNYCPLHE